jgi:spore germination protein YaaH
MNKLVLFIFSFVSFALLGQGHQSIHQLQLEEYNNLGNSTADYYENNEPYTPQAQTKLGNCTLNKMVYGWHPYWVGSSYNNYDWDLLSHLSFFSYEVDQTDGSALITHGWATSAAVDAALANNTKVTLCVTLFGSTGLTAFLTNNTAKQNLITNLITNLISLVQSRGAHGVNIDFEGLPSAQKTNFANFMVDLSNQMHGQFRIQK